MFWLLNILLGPLAHMADFASRGVDGGFWTWGSVFKLVGALLFLALIGAGLYLGVVWIEDNLVP